MLILILFSYIICKYLYIRYVINMVDERSKNWEVCLKLDMLINYSFIMGLLRFLLVLFIFLFIFIMYGELIVIFCCKELFVDIYFVMFYIFMELL